MFSLRITDNDYDPNSIYRTHFHDPEQPKLIPNPAAIEKVCPAHDSLGYIGSVRWQQ